MHTTGVQCQGAQTISWPRYVRWWMYAFAIWICLYVVYASSVPTTISQSRSNGKSFIKYSIILSLRMSGQRMSTLFSRYVCERACVCVCVCCFFLTASTSQFVECYCYFCNAFSENNDKNFHTKRHLHTLSSLMFVACVNSMFCMFPGHGQWL